MSRTQTSESRLAQFTGAGSGRPKYASLTAGLLARKGEAVPATPYYAAEALDLFVDRPHGPHPAAPEPGPEPAEVREPRAAERSTVANDANAPGWRLRRLGLDLRARAAPPRDRHEAREDIESRAPEPAPTPEPSVEPVPEAVPQIADNVADVRPYLQAVAPPAPPVHGDTGTVGPYADQTVRFEASLPATLFARLALAANRSARPTDDLMQKALEAYFEAAGIPRACLAETH